MGVNTEIRLPLHVRSIHVLQVIGKVVGEPWAITGGTLVDPSKPSGSSNPWSVLFSNLSGPSKTMEIKTIDPSGAYGLMAFQDAAGTAHEWNWFPEAEYEEWKLLRPRSHALAVAVGKRLVGFFGGQVCYSDTSDAIDFEVTIEKARFGPRQRSHAETPDDRWYQFQTALLSEPPLTRSELTDAWAVAGQGPGYQKLMEVLEAQEMHAHMDRQIPKGSVRRKGPGGRL